ncbi:MAG TPA: amino acid adenylation domain-containing protein [Pyrinomonadaceae bacterium]|jgi:amino acid adenylation domain-containing protein
MTIEKTGSQDVFAPPVSYAQERLWFLEKFEPNTAIYNIPYIANVKGSIHRNAFNKAVNRLIARHESLRTSFIEFVGKPKQAIHEELSVEVDWIDLSRLDAHACAEKLQEICTESTSTPFDLSKAPLFRIMLVASARETAIITTIHHIISDGWSIGVFQRELSALYQEELGGRPATLPEMRVQYADYAIWQRETLEGEELSRLKHYWRHQLDEATTVLEIPSDYQRPLKQTFNGDVHLFDLPPELVADIKALTNRQETTLFMTLFSAFAVLLYRLTGQEDVLVGTPIAGRRDAELENLIGLFVNTLVLRARMEPSKPFVQLLSEVKQMTIEAFEHQDMPFEKLVLELNPKRDLSHSPLIQILFSLQNIPPLQKLLSGVTETDAGMSQNLDGHTGTAKFDLALFVSEVGDMLQCSIEFNTDLFSTKTIENISGYFVKLLDGIVKDPEAGISSYAVMSVERKQRCLEDSRGKDYAYSETKGCHHLFENQCRKLPDAIAVSLAFDKVREQVTYAELNAYANRIARYLTARGVKSGDKIALCIPRNIHQIAAVLGIVKAGAVYVPLDQEYPPERLRFILSDVNAPLLITSVDTRVNLDEFVETIVLEQEAEEIDKQSSDNLDIAYAPEMPLYVIHTSGSTGQPKGVVMPHRSIVNLIEWQARNSSVKPGDITLQYAPLNFDVASQEIFSTLTSGGCLQLIDEGVRRESPRLLDFLKKQGVSRLFLPPVALEQLANAAQSKDVKLEKLREVIVAGDKLQVTDNIRRFFENLPEARLINQYGPTETHVVSAHTLEGSAAEWSVNPSIGKPIDNVQLYILDENLEPKPPKVAGELYIGGVAVALGYLNLLEESGRRFIKNPFQKDGGLLYRTGDVCHYDNDGALTFLGRADQQIKLRGFRIELGELEVVLKRHDSIKDAVVVKLQSIQGDDQLAAYLVVKENAVLDKAELRSYLADKLPVYMIPTHFVRLDSFPLTGSGKIDRRKLPEPVKKGLARDGEPTYVAARTPVERFLAGCWCNLLQLEKVSIHDNFFELGGHSLTATQFVSRIRDEFGLELPLYRVFERPTIELLALEIIQKQAAQEEQSELEALLSELESLSEEDLEELLSESRDD